MYYILQSYFTYHTVNEIVNSNVGFCSYHSFLTVVECLIEIEGLGV